HDLAARTPKYYEDNRSLVDMLHGKADASDRSSASFIFGSLKDKITQAAGGAVQALGGGFNKLASNNFDSFVRNNPILLIEHLETEKATASEERLEEIEKEIEALTEFQKRQLDSFTTWFKEKNKDLTKAKRAIEKLEEDRIPENTLETDAKIEKILASSKDSDLSLSQNKLRIRAELAFTALQAILDEENNKDNPNSKKIETINADMELIQNTLLAGAESDIDVDQAITNGAAIAVNKAIASELKRVDPSNIADVKDLYQRYDFLELADTTGLVIDSDALSEAVEASIQSPNAHAALYASELLEAGKINARFYNRKLPEASQDGSFGEDNQLAPPQISPTTGSAALAAIGNRILSLANGVLYEADLPGKEWVQDKAQIIASIGDKISDPNLAFSSAGAVFLNQLREGFKTTIRSFFNTHSSSKNKIDDAKTVYKYIKNLKQNTEIEGAATEAMDEIEAALNWLGTEDAELATDRIFVSKPLHKSINDIRKFVNKGNLDYSDDNFTNQLNLNSLRTQLVVLYDPTGSLDTVKTKVEELEELLGTEDYETAWNNLIKEIKAELQTAYQTTKNDKVDEYLQKTDLGSIKARLEDIRDSASDDIDDLNNDIDDINRSINRLRNERSSRAGIRDNLIGLLNGENFNLSQIIDALRGEIDLDDFDLDDIDDDDEDLNLRDLISNIISNLNNRINFLNGNGSNSIRGLEDRRSAKQAEITRITSQGTRARRLLGEGSEFGIDDIIAHLDSKRADIIREIGLDPNISDSELKSELKEYRKQLNNDYAQELISSDSLATIEDQLGTVLRSTDLDLDGNSIRDEVTGELLYNGNDFLDLDKVINGVGEIADQVSTVFGQDYDKGQKLAQLEKAVVTKQVLQAELAQMIRDELDKPETGTTRAAELNQMLIPLEADIEDLGDLDEDLKVNTTQVLRQVIDTSFIGAPTSPEKIDELAKALYGFETIEDSEDIIIGSADDLKDRSLISAIDDLKVDARNILEQDLPDDDTDLVNLVNNTKDDHIGFEKQSIKRLILLMFVLSMLEYSDWDYRKQEADPSRYAVF
ncbi:MAG: hypothetical protein OXU45_04710, partial [Candidatus Melainabacteria bacterium]|nr:hypothetical protein [Candidatus Melainabacteria bacterium]